VLRDFAKAQSFCDALRQIHVLCHIYWLDMYKYFVIITFVELWNAKRRFCVEQFFCCLRREVFFPLVAVVE
jgi:hypothetical protein